MVVLGSNGMRWWVVSGAAITLAACDPSARDPQVDSEVRSIFDKARHHDNAEIVARFDPVLDDRGVAQLATLEGYIPAAEPRGRKIIGTNSVEVMGKGETIDATDEYDYGDRRILVDTRLYRTTGSRDWRIQGLHVETATSAELASNRFSLTGKSAFQYLFLAFAIASPLLMLAALIKVVRAPGLRRKWLWGVAAIAGLVALQMNWTTGQLSYQLFMVQLIGAGAMRGPSGFSPWILSATIPVGAILILTGVWANPRRARRPASSTTGQSAA